MPRSRSRFTELWWMATLDLPMCNARWVSYGTASAVPTGQRSTRRVNLVMEIRQITSRYYVSPQIDPSNMDALSNAGFTVVINNRPDYEIGPELKSSLMERAATQTGLHFIANSLTMDTMTPDRLILQRQILEDAEGKVLAYCRSGTRSTICWALGHAHDTPPSDLIGAAMKGGYDIKSLALTLENTFQPI